MNDQVSPSLQKQKFWKISGRMLNGKKYIPARWERIWNRYDLSGNFLKRKPIYSLKEITFETFLKQEMLVE